MADIVEAEIPEDANNFSNAKETERLIFGVAS
jgi:hypothetical protein